MHDQKFEKIFRPRPEDRQYGSNEPKKCEIHPVVSSIVHFKVFKSYFIYIIDSKCWIQQHSLLYNDVCLFLYVLYTFCERSTK